MIYLKHSNVVSKRIYLGRDGAVCCTKWWTRTLLSAPRGCLQRGDERHCDAVNCYVEERKRRMAIQFPSTSHCTLGGREQEVVKSAAYGAPLKARIIAIRDNYFLNLTQENAHYFNNLNYDVFECTH